MANSKIDIMSQAAVLLGDVEFSSVGETPASTTINTIYETLIQKLITDYPWRFVMAKRSLGRDVDNPPANDYLYSYIIPSEVLNGLPEAVYDSTSTDAKPVANFEIFGSRIYTDNEICLIDHKQRIDEKYWPAHFVSLAVVACAAWAGGSVTDQDNIQDRWMRTAFGSPQENGRGGMFASAMETDALGAGQQEIESDYLHDVRFS